MARQLEVTADSWPIGPQNRVRRRGYKFSIDDHAAHILVGMGKARYVDRAMTSEEETPLPRPKRRYARRDMQASD